MMVFSCKSSPWLLGLVLLLAIFSRVEVMAADAPKVERTALPSWVEPVAVDFSAMKKRADVDSGKNRLLVEQQVNVAEGIRFGHYATQFLTENAVQEGARISITFDPGYETLEFHRLIVHRGGKPMDRLAQQEIKVLQREARLDYHLYDGRLSGVIILEDVRVGDVLEYAYSVRGQNPIFGGRFMDSLDTSWSEPVHHLLYRVFCPSNRTLAFKSHGGTFEPKVTPREGATEYLWESRQLPSVMSDGDVPSWFDPWSWIQISEFDSWGAVARWAAEIHAVPATIPDELEKEVSEMAQLPSEQARILAALRYVQDNIRYLGVEVGENSHKPYPIETILARRFGDCKDKARMLSAMLRRLGFQASPALVETDLRHTIADFLPTALAFDHVVVQLRLHGANVWLDPTDRDQGGSLDKIYFPAYGQALVISPETTALTPILPQGFADTSVEVAEAIDLSDFGGAATLRVRTVWRGHEADNIRSNLADTSIESIRKSNLNYYARLYPQIEAAAPPSFKDDWAENVIIAEEKYLISEFWTPSEQAADTLRGEVYSQTMQDLLERPSTRVRTMPYAVSHPNKASHSIEINFPRRMNFSNEQTVVDDPAFRFAYSLVSAGQKLTIHHNYESRSDHVAPKAIGKFLSNIEKARGWLTYEISIPSNWAAGKTWTSDAFGSAGHGAASMPNKSPWATIVCGTILAGGVVLYLRRRAVSAGMVGESYRNLHRCAVCGATEATDPSLEFRVASNGRDYCHRHLPRR